MRCKTASSSLLLGGIGNYIINRSNSIKDLHLSFVSSVIYRNCREHSMQIVVLLILFTIQVCVLFDNLKLAFYVHLKNQIESIQRKFIKFLLLARWCISFFNLNKLLCRHELALLDERHIPAATAMLHKIKNVGGDPK